MLFVPGGRAAILTFHSGEDKLVKKALKEGYKAGIYSGLCQRRDSSLSPGVRSKRPGPLYENALGHQSIRRE